MHTPEIAYHADKDQPEVSVSSLNAPCELFLAPGGSIRHANGLLWVDTLSGQVLLPSVSSDVVEATLLLNDHWVAESTLRERVTRSQNTDMLPQLHSVLQRLTENQLLRRGVFLDHEPLAVLLCSPVYYELNDRSVQLETDYILSRFSLVRRVDDRFILESPLAHSSINLCHRRTLELIYELACPCNPLKLARCVGLPDKTVVALLSLLVAEGFASKYNSHGAAQIDDTQALRQWDFHDLLFHSRSRIGRHSNALGGTFRFKGKIPPRPAVKPYMSYERIFLPRPDMDWLMQHDMTLTQAIEQRVSVRRYGSIPVTLQELGEFLYRVARIKGSFTSEEVEYTSRPYPGGGASYELEIYLVVDRCIGLRPGLYHYNPLEHALFLLSGPTLNTEQFLLDAWNACARLSRPEILFIIAARFQRVSWKYESMAYATIMKDVGVLYQTMYLVATAMNLGPCALGAGNSDLFSQTIAEDYVVESSVGEFALGNRREWYWTTPLFGIPPGSIGP